MCGDKAMRGAYAAGAPKNAARFSAVSKCHTRPDHSAAKRAEPRVARAPGLR